MLPSGEKFDERTRMQKRANIRCWRFAVKLIILTALTLSLSVAGLSFSAGRMGSGKPGLGYEPTTGWQGADECVKDHAVRGPAEHRAATEVGRGLPMSPTQEKRCGEIL